MSATGLEDISDVELRQKLVSLGFSPGPMTSGTRRVYELKYLKMAGNLADSSSEGDASSDDSPVQEETQNTSMVSEKYSTPEKPPAPRTPIKVTPSKRPALNTTAPVADVAKSNSAYWKVRAGAVLALAIVLYVWFG